MAAPTRIHTLNIGTQSISLADLRAAEGGGLTLVGYYVTELAPSETSSEATRKVQIQSAVTELMTESGIKSGPINYAVTAQSVFTRFVKLPAVGEDKIDQIIQFEAQQNVPFPINEVVWDYQLVGNGEDGKLEVVLVAIKAELLNDMNGGVEKAGFKTNLVDVAPMALYNAFRYNYSSLAGCSLLIDIGARTTNLIFVEPRKVFSRSIPIGGNTITSAISKELEVSFGAAENRKRKDGYVSLGGSYADHADPEVARMSKIIRNTMTRLHAEITRSISFYRAQQQGNQPVRVFLCGGSANLPYLREFFSEKLQLPIEFLNPLRNVGVGGSVDVDKVSRHAHEMGELIGLGLRSGSECPMELNLRPETVIRQQELDARKPFFLAAGLCALLALAGWWFYYSKAASIKGEALEHVSAKVTELQGFESRIRTVSKEIDGLEKGVQPLLMAAREREQWTSIMEEIHQKLPESFIWVTALEPLASKAEAKADARPDPRNDSKNDLKGAPKGPVLTTAGPADIGKLAIAPPSGPSTPGAPVGKEQPMRITWLRLKGLYMGDPPNPKGPALVDNFVENLQTSPLVDGKPEIVKRTTPTQLEWAYDFELNVKLKQPLEIQ